MRIGFITTYFLPFRGGAEETVFHLANQISKNNEVHVFTSDRKNGKIINKKEELFNNIKIHRSSTFFRYRYYVAFYPSLLINLLKYDLDVIHTNSLGFLWHDLCLLIKKLQSPKTKIIITPHGPFMALKNYGFFQILAKLIISFIDRLFCGLYDKVIEVNPYQSSWLVGYGFKDSDIVHIPNGIDSSLLKITKNNSVLKKNNLNNKLVISYVGRLHKYKGIDQVLKVLPDLIKIKKNIVFVMMGQEGDYINELKNLVDSNNLNNSVRFLIDKSDGEKFAILQDSEIFVLPSEWEAFGVSILEAMAKSNAVISTTTEGGRFLINKDNGLLYDFGDLNALKSCFIKLINNDSLRLSMQKCNHIKASSFTWQNISKDVENIYKN